MKLWIDDVRPAPSGYAWIRSVNDTIEYIKGLDRLYEASGRNDFYTVELIDMDHDAGEYSNAGGDYIRILDWMEENNQSYPIHIHSMNPVGVENMLRIIRRNGWKYIPYP